MKRKDETKKKKMTETVTQVRKRERKNTGRHKKEEMLM